jgi:hypothetical protein
MNQNVKMFNLFVFAISRIMNVPPKMFYLFVFAISLFVHFHLTAFIGLSVSCQLDACSTEQCNLPNDECASKQIQ